MNHILYLSSKVCLAVLSFGTQTQQVDDVPPLQPKFILCSPKGGTVYCNARVVESPAAAIAGQSIPEATETILEVTELSSIGSEDVRIALPPNWSSPHPLGVDLGRVSRRDGNLTTRLPGFVGRWRDEEGENNYRIGVIESVTLRDLGVISLGATQSQSILAFDATLGDDGVLQDWCVLVARHSAGTSHIDLWSSIGRAGARRFPLGLYRHSPGLARRMQGGVEMMKHPTGATGTIAWFAPFGEYQTLVQVNYGEQEHRIEIDCCGTQSVQSVLREGVLQRIVIVPDDRRVKRESTDVLELPYIEIERDRVTLRKWGLRGDRVGLPLPGGTTKRTWQGEVYVYLEWWGLLNQNTNPTVLCVLSGLWGCYLVRAEHVGESQFSPRVVCDLISFKGTIPFIWGRGAHRVDIDGQCVIALHAGVRYSGRDSAGFVRLSTSVRDGADELQWLGTVAAEK